MTVTPSAPYARILVENYLPGALRLVADRERLVDYVSEADIRIRRPARVRVVLVDKDGWTPIATSAPWCSASVAGGAGSRRHGEAEPRSCVIADGFASESKSTRALPPRSIRRV